MASVELFVSLLNSGFMSEIDAVDALSTVLLSDVPTVPDYFFQTYTGSTIHLVWSSMDGSGLGGCVNASFSQQFCLGYEVIYIRRFRCLN